MEYEHQNEGRDLDKLGDYYYRHVDAMTTEGLHSKSHIAAELAWRDYQIDLLREALTRLIEYPGIDGYVGSILSDKARAALRGEGDE